MTLALVLFALAASPVQVEPPVLTLGADPEAAIVLIAPGARSVLAFAANGVGVLSPPESVGNGRFRARFTLPKERFPQLALIRVELESESGVRSRHWLALPLIANADLKIETKPRATVTVTIGETTFGPAIADARGNVKIPARVPPGFATATVLAVDRAGNQTTRPLDLLPRPFPRAAGVLAAEEATPDQPAQLELFAVEPDGRPLSRVGDLRLSAKLGSCEPPMVRADGALVATYRAPASVAAGRDVITIGVEGSPSITELEVKLASGAPARLVLSLSPPAFTAGSGIAPRLRVDAVDAHGNPATLAKPQFTPDFGRIEATVDGLLLRVPDDFGGRSHLRLRATTGVVSGEVEVPLIAAAPVRAELTFPERVAAGETALGRIFLVDAFGNAVEHASVGVVLTPERSATVTDAGGGHYDVELSIEPARLPGEQELQLTANGQAVGRANVSVLRYQRRWSVTLGALGFVQSSLGQWVSGGPRLSLGLRVAQTGLDLVAEGAFGLYAPIRGARSLNGGPSFDVQLQELSAAAGARYWIPVGVRTSLHLSIVGGGQRTSSTVYPSASPDAKSSETRWGPVVRAGGGAAFYLGFGRVTAQLDYTLAPSTGIIRGNVGGAGLSLGYLASF